MALSDTSLPLVATVLTLTLDSSGEASSPGPLTEAESLGIVAPSLVAPGISAGQGSLSERAVGGVSEMDPAGGSDEPGVVAAAVPEALAPGSGPCWGCDKADEGAGAAGRGSGDGYVRASRLPIDAGAGAPGAGRRVESAVGPRSAGGRRAGGHGSPDADRPDGRDRVRDRGIPASLGNRPRSRDPDGGGQRGHRTVRDRAGGNRPGCG